MRLRVLVLALVVASAGAASGTLQSSASPGPMTTARAAMREPACPLPSRYRGAFERRARDDPPAAAPRRGRARRVADRPERALGPGRAGHPPGAPLDGGRPRSRR